MDSLVLEAADLVEARRNTLAAQTKVEASQQKTSIKVVNWFFGILDTSNSINNSTSDSQFSMKT